MKAKTLNTWYAIRSSYWFVPSLMAISAVILSFISVNVDRLAGAEWIRVIGRIFGSDPDPAGARLLLATIAGSMITVAGVAYSVTVVALSLASSQYGPRLLTNFMRDTGNQIVLGTFIATFLYCLLVLLAVIGSAEGGFVPPISLTIAVVLALASVAVFIFFVHHAAESIHVENILAKVSDDIDTIIDRVFTKKGSNYESDAEETDSIPLMDSPGNYLEGALIYSTGNGYLQTIDRTSLIQLAEQNGLVIRCRQSPGNFVNSGSILALVTPETDLSDHVGASIRRKFLLGYRRTYEQDVEFALDQLVEIGVRSLSSGINDPFTVMMCLDRLGSVISRVVNESAAPRRFFDSAGDLRLVEVPFTKEAMVHLAFNQIREQGSAHTAVTIHLLCALNTVAEQCTDARMNSILLHHAELTMESYRQYHNGGHDLNRVQLAYRAAVESISSKACGRAVQGDAF